MPIKHNFHTLSEELDRWSSAGKSARLWLRDDDAQKPTLALDGLLSRVRSYGAPCLLAVIPMLSDEPLALRLRTEPLIRVAMHGAWHTNHAPLGQKSLEMAIERGISTIFAELSEARKRLISYFGCDAGDWYVPPWNRIDKKVAEHLPTVGFRAISTFSHDLSHLSPALKQVNTHVDLIDWKGGRIGRTLDTVVTELTRQLSIARTKKWAAVGILTHHLVHDEQAWFVLEALLDFVSQHTSASWVAPDDLLNG